ncbi:hypothetical protein [Actinomycetospora sp. NBRC 106378]|uniref:hypothetical protein n=1 Tax=Actinomycetospora sp. NBRC 106378 TaxID=3032208 RepID=UPI0024A09474|nr:hypothetical protein [Actinomycetospora sp. NBRC 106378]GLZ51354.1 hypothetical protein Acsp07_09710 [Actinomycetospora sp. NBRC 106378]
MHAELLTQRVVEIIESAALPHLDSSALVAALAVVLAGAGLVIVRDYALGGGDSLPLLVAEPFPRVEASLGVVPALGGIDGAVTARLRRYAEHPAVDGLVIVNGLTGDIPRPRALSGVPMRVAVAGTRTGSDAS